MKLYLITMLKKYNKSFYVVAYGLDKARELVLVKLEEWNYDISDVKEITVIAEDEQYGSYDWLIQE